MCLAIPGKIVSLHDAQGVKMAKVDFGGVSARLRRRRSIAQVSAGARYLSDGFCVIRFFNVSAPKPSPTRVAAARNGPRVSILVRDEANTPNRATASTINN